MVFRKQHVQQLEVDGFVTLDSWKTCVSILPVVTTPFDGVSCFVAGSGKTVLWFVNRLIISTRGH
jgi:hypothetical protein